MRAWYSLTFLHSAGKKLGLALLQDNHMNVVSGDELTLYVHLQPIEEYTLQDVAQVTGFDHFTKSPAPSYSRMPCGLQSTTVIHQARCTACRKLSGSSEPAKNGKNGPVISILAPGVKAPDSYEDLIAATTERQATAQAVVDECGRLLDGLRALQNNELQKQQLVRDTDDLKVRIGALL